jgi:hypothetical protein
MAFVKASTAGCGTSFSTKPCSSASITPEAVSRIGPTTTTTGVRTALGYLTPAAYAANLSATCDRLRNPDQLRRSHIAPPAPDGAKSAETLIAAG